MTQKDTWFDAFFNAVTGSKEFKRVVEKDWKWDLWDALKQMEASVAKAWDITKAFETTFGTPEAIETGKSLTRKDTPKTTSEKSVKNAWDDESRKISVVPEYFTMKNPDTWWFKWVAGMQKLKDNLRDWFIRPLQFLFLVRNLKEKYELQEKKSVGDAGMRSDTPKEVKEKRLVELYESYEKFQVWIPTGMLLYGPPGTGKTFITKKLAEEMWAGLIKKSVWEFWSSYLHETSKNIREFFVQAKKASESWPMILFLDEIDSLVSKRTDKVDSNKAEEVSQFLQEFNALEEAPNLIADWYVAADIEAIVEEAARDASGSILDIAQKLQEHDGDISEIEHALENHEINQSLLEIAISETVASIKLVDMSVFEKWEKTIA